MISIINAIVFAFDWSKLPNNKFNPQNLIIIFSAASSRL
jgi:hypothetical protein